MIAECYWAGTSAIALEELGHRESFDLDFHSRHAFVDTRPFLAELQQAFASSLELIQAPDTRGSGFSADKVQCVLERIEARDLVDIRAVLRARPRLRYAFQKAVATQDALLLAERLLGWTEEALREDLLAYPGVDPADAISMRDEFLGLLKTEGDPR